MDSTVAVIVLEPLTSEVLLLFAFSVSLVRGDAPFVAPFEARCEAKSWPLM